MPNKQDESAAPETANFGARNHDFDDDTDEAIVLPKVRPEITREERDAEDAEKKKADADFEDIEIEVDEDEMQAELENQPPGRKY